MTTTLMDGQHSWAAPAYEDLTGKLNLFAGMDATGKIMVARAGQVVIGTIIEEATLGNPASVQQGGVAKVIAGATVQAGKEVEADGAGKAITLASGKRAGIAETGGASGELISVNLDR